MQETSCYIFSVWKSDELMTDDSNESNEYNIVQLLLVFELLLTNLFEPFHFICVLRARVVQH